MKKNPHGELVYSEDDVFDLIMQGTEPKSLTGLVVEGNVDLETAALILEDIPAFVAYNRKTENQTTQEFDHRNQQTWFMPDSYKELDIAEHVLSLCKTDAELQRCGQELMMYQERGLFDLLRYLKYIVDLMTENRLIWGVGRGSSVASYVLYLLKVHRIDSMYYELDPAEFLR